MDIASLSNNVSAGNLEDSELEKQLTILLLIKTSQTINLSYGNGVVVEGAGFFLNNEMDDFSAKPGFTECLWFNQIKTK